jgi:hypothetical protein
LPQYWDGAESHLSFELIPRYRQDQPKQDFSSKRAERSEDKEAIGADLKRLSNACNEILNKRDFDLELPGSQEFVDCLATEFRSRFDNMTEPVSFSDQMALWQEFAKQHPEFNFRIIDMAVLFDQRLKKASVEVRFSIRGVSNIIMEAVARLKWRREDRGWVCFDLTAMRFAVPTFM